jgi:hypothetical protein
MSQKKFLVYIILVFIVGGLVGFVVGKCLKGAWRHERYGMERTENGPKGKLSGNMEWKTEVFGGVSFQYPADWKLNPVNYTTPAGATDRVGYEVIPRTQNSGADKIGIGGRQVSCAMFSNDRIKCKEVNGLAFYTTSEVPDVVYVYNQMVNTATESTSSPQANTTEAPSVE